MNWAFPMFLLAVGLFIVGALFFNLERFPFFQNFWIFLGNPQINGWAPNKDPHTLECAVHSITQVPNLRRHASTQRALTIFCAGLMGVAGNAGPAAPSRSWSCGTVVTRRQSSIFTHYGPVLAGGRLIVTSSDGLIRQFDPTSGALIGQITLPGGAASGPVVAGETLYVISKTGQLHAFR